VQKRHLFGILLVLLIASFLRLWALPDLPSGLHYDLAANVIITRQIASGESWPLFITAYTGKETLFFYWAALWMNLLGGAAWAIKLAAASAGVLTIAATYSATRSMTYGRRDSHYIALFAAAWLAVAFPHIMLSRYGFRAITQPLLEMLTLAAIWHGWRTNQWRWLIAGGLFLGLTGYTYLAARLFPIPLALAFLWLILSAARESRRQRLKQTGLIVLVAALTFAPLGIFFLTHPGTFDTRIDQVAASSALDALNGIWACLKGLVVPGTGDPYIRFNLPGRPVLDIIYALLALAGLASLLLKRTREDWQTAGRLMLLLSPFVLLLPSALATSEITPSNLRLVGIYPFLAILVGLGMAELLHYIPPAPLRSSIAFGLFLIPGALISGVAYHQWATSNELFLANDGEMTLAAQALDQTDLTHTTVYIASIHYRHPTVAALASHYPAAKWLTGGETLVMPAQGDALYLVPASLQPPAPWPTQITQRWKVTTLRGPDGSPALYAYRLSAADIQALHPQDTPADFAHVTWVHSARPLNQCQVAQSCPILVTWEVRAPYAELQAVASLTHPSSGQWDRVNPFHYPTADWTVGDIVFDQLVLTPPAGTPPVNGYQVGISFFNPSTKEILPRLKDEQFAGLDVSYPIGSLQKADATRQPAPGATVDLCADLPTQPYTLTTGLSLRSSNPPGTARPGEKVDLTFCWQAPSTARLTSQPVTLSLAGPTITVLSAGAPVQGQYPFSLWQMGERVIDRFAVRLPRTLTAGNYSMTLAVGADQPINLGQIDVPAMAHDFKSPSPSHPLQAQFGTPIKLLGYDVGSAQAGQPLTLKLYWQPLQEMEVDYTVFVHLLDHASGKIVTQVDEQPLHQTYPMSLWVSGEVVTDEHTLTIPADATAGQYDVVVGLYVQSSGEHLLVNGGTGFTIGNLTVSH
jgi:hypothetical protein